VGIVGACVLLLSCGGSGKGAIEEPKGGGDAEDPPPPPGDDDDDGQGGGNPDNLNGLPPDPDKGKDPPPPKDPPKDPDKAPAAIKTSESPHKMSEFLVKPAKDATAKRQWALAVTYYQALVEARGAPSPDAYELAMRWVDAGEFASAVDVLNRYIDSTPSAEDRAAKLVIRDNLIKAGARNKFTRPFEPVYASADAVKVFDLGRNAFKAGKYADAEFYFRLGARLDPNLKGFLRELGATYDKLGMRKEKIFYYAQYLTSSPFGANADFARGALAKEKGAMGKLSLKSALPCDGGVWVNGKKLPGKLPMKDLPMPAGRHGASCWNVGYEIYQIEWFDVPAGKTKDVGFNWAVVYNDLTTNGPAGHIFLEDVTDPSGALRKLLRKPPGEGIGVPVPADGHPMKYRLEASDGSGKFRDGLQRLQPGEQFHFKW
jgi:tetratricopeptide (TPR) repeat protein